MLLGPANPANWCALGSRSMSKGVHHFEALPIGFRKCALDLDYPWVLRRVIKWETTNPELASLPNNVVLTESPAPNQRETWEHTKVQVPIIPLHALQ